MTDEGKRRRNHLERLKNFSLMDDEFMTQCFDGAPECVELVLRIVLGKPDLKVIESHTQVFVANLLKRSVRLDVLAAESIGKRCNVEIQRANKGAGFKRARFHSSVMDTKLLEKAGDFDDLPETYVIFITEKDVMGMGLPLYTVNRYVEETGKRFEDEEHIIYVNGAYRGDTELGKLMHDFSCSNPDDMNFPVLADRVRFFKEEKEGIETMCQLMEDLYNEGVENGIKIGEERGEEKGIKIGEEIGARNMVREMIRSGELTLKSIAQISGLSLEELKKIEMEPIVGNS